MSGIVVALVPAAIIGVMLSMRLPARMRLGYWLACFAILFGSLGPSLAQTLLAPERTASSWSEICTALGVKLIKLAETSESADLASAGHGAHELTTEHCLYCQTAESPALMAADSLPLRLALRGQSLPSFLYRSPRPLFTWSVAYPRAPPSNA